MARNANKQQSPEEIHFNAANFRDDLLKWYEQAQRALPWRLDRRIHANEKPNPYHVWLSEIMLQQTVVATVIPYFLKFIKKWPDIHALAKANNEEIMREWAGLGYYARARNLHKCANVISEEFDGIFPQEKAELLKLPGIGEYTASAILAIAYDRDVSVVDGNIERIISRIFKITVPLPASKSSINECAGILAGDLIGRAGCYTQALMDLGASICIPKSPKCMACPVQKYCIAYDAGIAPDLPYKKQKKSKPYRYGYIFWIENEKGEILLERRDERGLLGGMMAFPTSDWLERSKGDPEMKFESIEAGRFKKEINEKIFHSFTHFDLELQGVCANIAQAEISENSNKGFRWVSKNDILNVGLPSVFLKFAKMKIKQ